MKKGDLVSFNVICDDSDWASNCFGVEPQNDWFDIQVYVENLYGEIVKSNTIEQIRSDGTKTGRYFKVRNGIIESELNSLMGAKSKHGLSINQIFEGSGLKTIRKFTEIKVIEFIPLDSKGHTLSSEKRVYLDRIYMNNKTYIEEREV